MKCGSIIALLASFAAVSTAHGGTLTANMAIDSEQTNVAPADRPFDLKVKIFDAENPSGMLHFHPMHEKKLHLIIVSEDLKTFAHTHPDQPSEHVGRFVIGVNKPTTDPDNADAMNAVRLPGRYFVFAESMPMGFSMTNLPLDMVAVGPSRDLDPLVLDPISADGIIVKEFDGYHLSIKVTPFFHCNALSLTFDVHFQKWDESSQAFADVTDLDPWLKSFAHLIMISGAGNSAVEKHFYHLHTVWPLTDDPNTERGPDVTLGLHNHTSLYEGVMKAWLQFKHQGQIRTVPLVLDVKAPEGGEPMFRSMPQPQEYCLR